MVQWVTIVLGILGLVYNGYKDYSNGQIKAPLTTQNQTVESKPIMYWQVAFDPNTGKMYHLHKDGKWYDQPPQIREYSNQNQEALGVGNWTQGTPQYPNGQQAQTTSHPIRY